jgi:hypothetical protein
MIVEKELNAQLAKRCPFIDLFNGIAANYKRTTYLLELNVLVLRLLYRQIIYLDIKQQTKHHHDY